ncbi:hypothetical protein CFP56_036379 [Quercus suber]|uniref:Choline transporter-like protein n=1 Tax=Quercus suber TaxID=58331 RepID=A0AAW0LRA3_QUESU
MLNFQVKKCDFFFGFSLFCTAAISDNTEFKSLYRQNILFLFLLHMVAAVGLVFFLYSRESRPNTSFYLPQVEAASFLSITLALAWQKAVREWPLFWFISYYGAFVMSLSAGILLICFQKPALKALESVLLPLQLAMDCMLVWVTTELSFVHLNLFSNPWFESTCLLDAWGWILVDVPMDFSCDWSFEFLLSPLIIIALVLSLLWTAEVMRNVGNLTVSRVISLYYLRGMQSNTQFCFQRAMTLNLGSACLGSLFVPAIEALRIVARV